MQAPPRTPLPATLLALAILLAAGGSGSARAQEEAGASDGAIATVAEVQFVPVEEAGSGERVFSAAALRQDLRSEIGRRCEPARIEEELSVRYRFKGYVPTVQVACGDGTLRVTVRESSHRIVLITFDADDLKTINLVAGGKVPDERLLYPVPPTAPRAVILGLLQTKPGDLYNVERYRNDREETEKLGYVVVFVARPPRGPDQFGEGAYLIQSLRPLAEDPETRRKKDNYFGGTATYGPRTGGTAGLIYQRNDLFKPLDRLTISPTVSAAVGGEITYSAPLLAARESPRRLYDMNLGLFSNFTNNRLLGGVEMDERRSGLSATVGVRPLGLPAPHDLRFEFGVRREAVRFDDEPTAVEEADLTLLRLGMTHLWRHTYLSPGMTLRTLPTLEGSLGLGDGVPYIRPGLSVFLHSRLMSGFEIDLHVTGGGLDRPVPDFELFSLGGVATVRGFETDTFLGRGIAAAQAELWIPFARPLEAHRPTQDDPGNTSSAPFERIFARRLKAAVFVDGGVLWQSTAGGRQSLHGAGAGLRFVVPHQPLVIKLDYGWGLGNLGGDSYFYVSIGYSR